MRAFLVVLCFGCLQLLSAQGTSYESEPLAWASHVATSSAPLSHRTEFTDAESREIRERLREMDLIIDNRTHPTVESYLRGYLLRNREKSEMILGRVPAYFPIFEEELRKAGLPDDLKYLAIVESALIPKALSRAGAGGLWQFMPGTGKNFGLRIDETLDERGDVVLATRAAVQYLKEEYDRFGDWALVLAAYNSGPGRISRLVRRTGRKDYWSLQRHLPSETRNYVPAFVAAAYLLKYGDLHGLRPRMLSLDEQLPTWVPCPEGVSLKEVARATELPLSMLRELNAQCLRDYIPADKNAQCRVPARTAPALLEYLELRREGYDAYRLAEIQQRPVYEHMDYNYDHLYERVELFVPAGTHMREVAREHGYSVHHLRAWNPGASVHSSKDRYLRAYRSGHFTEQIAQPASVQRRVVTAIAALPTINLEEFKLPEPVSPTQLEGRFPNARYTLQRYETLLEVWQRYAHRMTWQEFVAWNAIAMDSTPRPGQELLIRQ